MPGRVAGQVAFITAKADVRDAAALAAAVSAGVAGLGRLDIVCANAGICTVQGWSDVTPRVWQETIDTNLTGVWNTFVAAIPHLTKILEDHPALGGTHMHA